MKHVGDYTSCLAFDRYIIQYHVNLIEEEYFRSVPNSNPL